MSDVVIREIAEDEYLDDNGNVVNKFDITKLGNNMRFRMLHPRYLLCVDELGSNTKA